MKNPVIQFLLLSVVYLVSWTIGMIFGFVLFPGGAVEASEGFDYKILLMCVLHGGILYLYARTINLKGKPFVFTLTAISFVLTFLITQVESIWFISPDQMDRELISALIAGGFIASFVFAVLAAWILGRFRGQGKKWHLPLNFEWRQIPWLVLLMVVVWPMIYFLAGYYIAWQSEAVRVYYAGSTEMLPFWEMMKNNISDGLYTFQAIRSILWLVIGAIILVPLSENTKWTKVVLTGGLFAILGSSQLLLENAVMPEDVRNIHLIETAISTFIWGGILAWVYVRWQHSTGRKRGGASSMQQAC